ncbi:MAG: MerR family transcriptional regulator [Chloroflexota bacterium]
MARPLRPVDLGRATGLSAQMARRYERWRFLPPAERSRTGRRLYGPRHLRAFLAVRAMQAGYGWRTGGQIMRRMLQGDLPGAFALVDACHAALHQRRREIEETLQALRVLAGGERDPTRRQPSKQRLWIKGEQPLLVGEAARRVGVRVSAVRFWEEQGLLRPPRDKESNYRLYDEAQVFRLQMVALLRQAGYRFDAIRAVLNELAAGRPSTALSAIERRREELNHASRKCAAATAAFWR